MGEIVHGGESLPLLAGKTVFDYADDLAVRVPTSCGRTGLCHECIVEVKAGQASLCATTEAEAFLRGDYRLACQAVIERSDEDIEFALLRSNPKILSTRPPKDLLLDPVVRREGESVLYGDDVIDKYRGHIYGVAIEPPWSPNWSTWKRARAPIWPRSKTHSGSAAAM